ncbi:hypothetical protein ACGFNF_12495 [Micromonospora sp. NPDC048868]|uniref:hypothetical protein n=1 Tax=Micromonospora sp. NPDC048868 TaxID=3364258 RepID=UPI00371FBAA6
MAEPLAALTRHYESLATKWQVCDRSGDYAPLVVPTGNSQEPFHRWFRMKEAYSHALLPQLLKEREAVPGGLSLLDPFSGGGTTAVSGISYARSVGVPVDIMAIERNPVLRVISHAKCAGIRRGSELAELTEDAYAQVVAASRRLKSRPELLDTPSVTLRNPSYYSDANRTSLLALGKAAAECELDSDARAVIQTCIAAAVEPAGRLRRDGRALRYTPERKPADPVDVFGESVNRCIVDMRLARAAEHGASFSLASGDARQVDVLSGGRRFNWIVFSPPYPNNIDYTEIYKTEAWALGFYDDIASMKAQRLKTLRSHTSLYFPEEYAYLSGRRSGDVQALISPVLAAIPVDRYERGRRQLVRGYVDDMLRVLAACRAICTDDAQLALVVGNSVHGIGENRFVIAADLLIAALGELSGWEVVEIRIARRLRRRSTDSRYSRESVVVLRPSLAFNSCDEISPLHKPA